MLSSKPGKTGLWEFGRKSISLSFSISSVLRTTLWKHRFLGWKHSFLSQRQFGGEPTSLGKWLGSHTSLTKTSEVKCWSTSYCWFHTYEVSLSINKLPPKYFFLDVFLCIRQAHALTAFLQVLHCHIPRTGQQTTLFFAFVVRKIRN